MSSDVARLERRLASMLACLSHRGPDDVHVERPHPSIGIGSTRLAILDPDNGRQPLGVNGRYISMNGEIYNYTELARTHLRDVDIRTKCDTEVALRMYERFGLDAISFFNGVFALCIVDGTSVYLIRDRLGVRPLYYREINGGIEFASEIKALIDNDCVHDWSIPDGYDFLETAIGRETLFEGIYRVMPGEMVSYTEGRIGRRIYWDLVERIGPVRQRSPQDAAEELRYLLIDAVRIQRPSEPFAVSISGGLDSAIVACIARPEVLITSVSPPDSSNEYGYCQILARHLSTPLMTVHPSPIEFARVLPQLVYTLDEPVTTLAAFPMFLVAKTVAASVRILMNGQGADELFGGYVRHAFLYLEYLARNAPELGAYNALAKHFWGENVTRDIADRYLDLVARGELSSEIAREMIVNVFSRLAGRPVTAAGLVDLKLSLPPLLRADDRVCGAFGIESRSPFLDHRIVEFALTLSDQAKVGFDNQRIDGGFVELKHILRRAVVEIVPDSIRNRLDKVGYPSPVGAWLVGPCKGLVDHLMSRAEMPEPFRQRATRRQGTRGSFDRSNWQFVQLAVWYLLFVCGHQQSRLGHDFEESIML